MCLQAALSLRILALLRTCTPQNLCNTLWAHAKVRESTPTLQITLHSSISKSAAARPASTLKQLSRLGRPPH